MQIQNALVCNGRGFGDDVIVKVTYIQQNGFKDVLFEHVSVPLQPDDSVVSVPVDPLKETETLVADILHLSQLIFTACVCVSVHVCMRVCVYKKHITAFERAVSHY